MCAILTSADASASGRPLNARTKIVCSVFARTADCHLDNHRSDRSQEDHQQRSDYPEAVIIVVAIAAEGSEKHAQLRQHGKSRPQ